MSKIKVGIIGVGSCAKSLKLAANILLLINHLFFLAYNLHIIFLATKSYLYHKKTITLQLNN